METDTTREVELKFVPSKEVQARLHSQHAPAQIVRILKCAFDLGDYTFSSETQLRLVDTYFDTEKLAFYRSHATFRLRDKGNGQLEVTFKTPQSHSPGVFDRKEHTTSVSHAEFEKLKNEGFRGLLASFAPEYAQESLSAILTIENDRRTYELTRNDERLELCLDAFRCDRIGVNSNRRQRFEIEIEAKTQAAIERLSRIKTNIGAIVPSLSAEDKSKYEQSVEELGLHRGRMFQRTLELYHSPNFGTWVGVGLGIIGILLSLVIYWLQ